VPGTHFPCVEAWYRGPVPVGSFVRYLLTRWDESETWRHVRTGLDALTTIEAIDAQWQKEAHAANEARKADGTFLDLKAAIAAAEARIAKR
jgi:hypothetical protein